MATRMQRLPVRTSATLRSIIDSAGPVNPATRALLWLGADAASLTIPTADRREIAVLLVEEGLAPDVVAALQRLYDRLAGTREGDTAGDISTAVTYDITGDTPGAVTRGVTRVPSAPEPVPAPAPRLSDESEDDPFTGVGREFEG